MFLFWSDVCLRKCLTWDSVHCIEHQFDCILYDFGYIHAIMWSIKISFCIIFLLISTLSPNTSWRSKCLYVISQSIWWKLQGWLAVGIPSSFLKNVIIVKDPIYLRHLIHQRSFFILSVIKWEVCWLADLDGSQMHSLETWFNTISSPVITDVDQTQSQNNYPFVLPRVVV